MEFIKNMKSWVPLCNLMKGPTSSRKSNSDWTKVAPSFLLPFPCSCICFGFLAPHWQTHLVSLASVALDVYKSLDVHRVKSPQVTWLDSRSVIFYFIHAERERQRGLVVSIYTTEAQSLIVNQCFRVLGFSFFLPTFNQVVAIFDLFSQLSKLFLAEILHSLILDACVGHDAFCGGWADTEDVGQAHLIDIRREKKRKKERTYAPAC